jgi:hypothetical protein
MGTTIIFVFPLVDSVHVCTFLVSFPGRFLCLVAMSDTSFCILVHESSGIEDRPPPDLILGQNVLHI